MDEVQQRERGAEAGHAVYRDGAPEADEAPQRESRPKVDEVQHAEARVGPWLEARICHLIKRNRAEDAGALFREFETPEKGF